MFQNNWLFLSFFIVTSKFYNTGRKEQLRDSSLTFEIFHEENLKNTFPFRESYLGLLNWESYSSSIFPKYYGDPHIFNLSML